LRASDASKDTRWINAKLSEGSDCIGKLAGKLLIRQILNALYGDVLFCLAPSAIKDAVGGRDASRFWRILFRHDRRQGAQRRFRVRPRQRSYF
jgi:hypothetical protein